MSTPMVHGSPEVGGSHTMTSFLSWLLSPQDYMPHGMCFLWQPELIALHVASDSAIALAYYSIPVALGYFVWKRTDLAPSSRQRPTGWVWAWRSANRSSKLITVACGRYLNPALGPCSPSHCPRPLEQAHDRKSVSRHDCRRR